MHFTLQKNFEQSDPSESTENQRKRKLKDQIFQKTSLKSQNYSPDSI